MLSLSKPSSKGKSDSLLNSGIQLRSLNKKCGYWRSSMNFFSMDLQRQLKLGGMSLGCCQKKLHQSSTSKKAGWVYSALVEKINPVGMQLVENDWNDGNFHGAHKVHPRLRCLGAWCCVNTQWEAIWALQRYSVNTVERQKAGIKRVTQGRTTTQQESEEMGLTRLKSQLTAVSISPDWFPFWFGV